MADVDARERLRVAIEDAMFPGMTDEEHEAWEKHRQSPNYEGIGWTISTRALDCVLTHRDELRELLGESS